MIDSRFRFSISHLGRLVAVAAISCFAANASAAGLDYLQLQRLYQFLDAKPELSADAAKDRPAFLELTRYRASDDEKRLHASLTKQDKDAANEWLSGFAENQGLFPKDELLSKVKELRELDDADAQKWYRDAVSLRVVSELPEWEITNAWLVQFWEVQAMYKEKDLAELHQRLRKLTPTGLSFAMEHFIEVLGNRVQRQQAAATRRAPLRIVSQAPPVQRSTSGTPAGFIQQAPVQPRRNRQLPSSQLSRRVTDFYIYRGSFLY